MRTPSPSWLRFYSNTRLLRCRDLFLGRLGEGRFWFDAATAQLLLLQKRELLVWGKRGRIHQGSHNRWW